MDKRSKIHHGEKIHVQCLPGKNLFGESEFPRTFHLLKECIYFYSFCVLCLMLSVSIVDFSLTFIVSRLVLNVNIYFYMIY